MEFASKTARLAGDARWCVRMWDWAVPRSRYIPSRSPGRTWMLIVAVPTALS